MIAPEKPDQHTRVSVNALAVKLALENAYHAMPETRDIYDLVNAAYAALIAATPQTISLGGNHNPKDSAGSIPDFVPHDQPRRFTDEQMLEAIAITIRETRRFPFLGIPAEELAKTTFENISRKLAESTESSVKPAQKETT